MSEKIYFSEWTDTELKEKNKCFCACHTHPGMYPTTENDPCHMCHHVNLYGYFPGSTLNGWIEYWRSDTAGIQVGTRK
jgi:hypothetical protein